MAANGAKVALAARQVPKLEELKNKLEECGSEVMVVEMDVLDQESITQGVAEVESKWAIPDILINNAGLAINKPFLDVEESEYDRVLDTNLKGCFFCAQAVARRMVEKKSGSIINISSVLGTRPIGTLTTYCASKGGLNQLTATMALELARYNIRVNAIAPGYICLLYTSPSPRDDT